MLGGYWHIFLSFFNLVEKHLLRVKKFLKCCENDIACLRKAKLQWRQPLYNMLLQTIECITFEYLLNRFFLKIPFSHATFPCSVKPKTLIRLIHHNQKQFAKLNVISKNIILNFEIFNIHEKKYVSIFGL